MDIETVTAQVMGGFKYFSHNLLVEEEMKKLIMLIVLFVSTMAHADNAKLWERYLNIRNQEITMAAGLIRVCMDNQQMPAAKQNVWKRRGHASYLAYYIQSLRDHRVARLELGNQLSSPCPRRLRKLQLEVEENEKRMQKLHKMFSMSPVEFEQELSRETPANREIFRCWYESYQKVQQP